MNSTPYPKPVGKEEVVYKGRILEIVHQPMQVSETKQIAFEWARRSPGVRLIIPIGGDKLRMSKEFRNELNDGKGGYDIRLPGGKVFDALTDYNVALANDVDMVSASKDAAIREAAEEVGIQANGLSHFATSENGTTVVWTLYYFVVSEFTQLENQSLEEGETIEIIDIPIKEVWQKCLDGTINEDRSVAILMRYISSIS